MDVAEEIMHGKTSLIYHDGKGMFKNLKNPFEAIRYHSLVVYKKDLPNELEISAETEKVMKNTKGKANPKLAQKKLKETLDKMA